MTTGAEQHRRREIGATNVPFWHHKTSLRDREGLRVGHQRPRLLWAPTDASDAIRTI